MSDDTKALVAELRGSVRDATPLGHRQLIWQGADTIERLERELARADEVADTATKGVYSKYMLEAADAVAHHLSQRMRITELERDRDALAERCEKLREALRPHVIIRYTMGGGACRRCHKEWSKGDSERHASGCLVAPKDAPCEKEGK